MIKISPCPSYLFHSRVFAFQFLLLEVCIFSGMSVNLTNSGTVDYLLTSLYYSLIKRQWNFKGLRISLEFFSPSKTETGKVGSAQGNGKQGQQQGQQRGYVNLQDSLM